jgi:mannitol/fructose-specific phosphotransferase system IIA component (Ntr-type)
MRFRDFFLSAGILDGGPEVSRESIIEQLLTLLCRDGHIPESNLLVIEYKIMQCESLGSSGIGQGIALPHTRTSMITRPMGAVARCRTGVNFDSLDGELADLFFLYLSPEVENKQRSREISEMSHRLMRQMCNDDFLARLRESDTPAELLAVLGDL